MKISYKFSLVVMGLMIVVVGGLSTFQLWRSFNIARELSLNYLESVVRDQTDFWSYSIANDIRSLNNLAGIMSMYETVPLELRREIYANMIRGMLEAEEHVIMLNSIWRPNALDGLDSQFIGTPGAGAQGQFAMVYTKENGFMERRSAIHDVVHTEAFLNRPDVAYVHRAEPPVAREIVNARGQRENAHLMRLQVPVFCHRTNEVVGAISNLTNIMVIQYAIEEILRTHPSITTMGVYFDNGFILGSYIPGMLGQNIADVDKIHAAHLAGITNAIQTGGTYAALTRSVLLDKPVHVRLGSFPVGNSGRTISVMVGVSDEIIMRESRALLRYTIIAAMITILLVAGLIFLVFSYVTKPIVKMTDSFMDIAQGAGDLTKTIPVSSKDEIGDMALYFNKTLDNIGNLVKAIKNKVNALTNTSSELAANMAKTSEAVDYISHNFETMKELKNKALEVDKQTNDALSDIRSDVSTLTKLVEEQSNNVSTSSSAIEQMTANIQSVSKTLAENVKNVQALMEASEHGKTGLQTVAEKIQEIARDSEGLLEINSVMENIASQTNLLSMNAAIEAAHAGETGKGFAVVAEEIRKLAELSSEQSKTTTDMLKKVKASIDSITKSSADVLTRFGYIDAGVKTVSDHEQNIRAAMEEQEAGSRQILESVGRLKEISVSVNKGTDGVSNSMIQLTERTSEFMDINGQVINGMEEIVTGAMTQIKTAINHVQEISEENNKNFTGLKQETEKFKVSADS